MGHPIEPGRTDAANPVARSVDDVVDDLTRVIAGCLRDGSRHGVFPSMYRTVTVTMADGVRRGHFDDPERVSRLVVVFADRYLDAYDAWQDGRPVTRSWEQAFRFARTTRGSIVQHLMLGMNAHINLDLGIAAAAVSSATDIHGLHPDFVRVNSLLFAMVDRCQAGLNTVSPWMRSLDRVGLGFDEASMRVGIRAARGSAWDLAERLVASSPVERVATIDQRDRATRDLGGLLCHRLSLLHVANRVVAMRERDDLGQVLEAVGSARIDWSTLGDG